jgi:hypothetical protein
MARSERSGAAWACPRPVAVPHGGRSAVWGDVFPWWVSRVPLTPFALLTTLRRLGHVAPCQELSNGKTALRGASSEQPKSKHSRAVLSPTTSMCCMRWPRCLHAYAITVPARHGGPPCRTLRNTSQVKTTDSTGWYRTRERIFGANRILLPTQSRQSLLHESRIALWNSLRLSGQSSAESAPDSMALLRSSNSARVRSVRARAANLRFGMGSSSAHVALHTVTRVRYRSSISACC